MQPTRNIHVSGEAGRRGRSSAVLNSISLALLATGLAGIGFAPAYAQLATTPSTLASSEEIKQREHELEATRAQQKSAAEAEAKLKLDIAAIGQDRSKLNAQLIDIAAQVAEDQAEGELRCQRALWCSANTAPRNFAARDSVALR